MHGRPLYLATCSFFRAFKTMRSTNLLTYLLTFFLSSFERRRRVVTLTFDPSTLKVRGTLSVTWSKSVRNLSEIEQATAELLIIFQLFAHVMSRCDLDLSPFDRDLLQHFGHHVFKLCTKFERNRIIHCYRTKLYQTLPCVRTNYTNWTFSS